jgi:plasmid stabilization system protein ParE
LELLTPAQRELEEIAYAHLELVGPLSARKITDRIYSALEKLRTYPDLGVACRDKQLAAEGYRMLICGNYLCFYRWIAAYSGLQASMPLIFQLFLFSQQKSVGFSESPLTPPLNG